MALIVGRKFFDRTGRGGNSDNFSRLKTIIVRRGFGIAETHSGGEW
jgi:hypothetical protein